MARALSCPNSCAYANAPSLAIDCDPPLQSEDKTNDTTAACAACLAGVMACVYRRAVHRRAVSFWRWWDSAIKLVSIMKGVSLLAKVPALQAECQSLPAGFP